MLRNFTFSVMVIAIMFMGCIKTYATDYTLSSSAININDPGSHTISGTGDSEVYITKSSTDLSNEVYNITLDNITLISKSWASAINVSNEASSGTMTVNFILRGNNTSEGYNHGGIQAISGVVAVVFTTIGGGTLTCSAQYDYDFAFKNSGGTLYVSVDPAVGATATLNGISMSVTDALEGAFSDKPLYLELSKLSTDVGKNEAPISVYSVTTNDDIIINGLAAGETYRIYDLSGRCLLCKNATGQPEKANLKPGVYVMKTTNKQIKIIR